MQINRLILFLLFVVFPGYLFSQNIELLETIDNDADTVLSGSFEPKQIIKVKIYNTKYKNDAYFSFLETDSFGNFTLTQNDISLEKIKDGIVVFEVSTNKEELSSSILNISKILDKGLLLKISSRGAYEYTSDNIINAAEMLSYVIEGETENNIKEMSIVISDSNSSSIKYELADLTIDENGKFELNNIDLSSLSDGKITIVASGVDIAGNRAKDEQELLKDSLVEAPVLLKKVKNNNLSNNVNRKILIASGTSEPLATIHFRFTQDEVVVEESVAASKEGTWEFLGADLDISVFKNKKVDVEIYQVDVAKNRSTVFKYFNNKFKRPIFPLVPLPIDPEKYQLIYTIDGHNDEIRDIVITETDIYVATYGYIKVWGKSYAKLQREVELKDVWVNSLVIANKKVYAALSNGNINIYSQDKLKLIKVIKADSLAILQLELYDDKLISSSESGLIKIWDINTYVSVKTFKNHQWDVGAIAIDGNILYSGSDDYSIKSWDLNSSKLLKTLKSAHTGTINDIVTYDKMIISASDDKKIIIRDMQSGEVIRTLIGHKKSVKKLKIERDFLISVSSDRTMIFWSLPSGKIIRKIKAHSKRVSAIEVNDFNIVTGSRDYKIKIWGYDDSVESLDDEDETKKAKYTLVKSFKVKKSIPTSLSQNENDIIVSTADGSLLFYNKTTHDFVKEYSTLDEIVKPKKRKKKKSVESLDYEDEDEEETVDIVAKRQYVYSVLNYGNQLLAALDDSTIKIWDMEKDKAIRLLQGTELATTDIALSTTYILSASKNGTIGVYDTETNSFVNLIEGHQYSINSLAIYEDDKVVSAGEDYSIRIREIESGDEVLEIKNAHDDIITKVLVYKNFLISASLDATIKIRDIESGKLLRVLDAHKAGVVSLSIDEENLISASKDNTLKAWSLDDFTLLATMDRHKKELVDVMITDDYIISISEDKTIKVWKYYE